jgi:hypothetical protein
VPPAGNASMPTGSPLSPAADLRTVLLGTYFFGKSLTKWEPVGHEYSLKSMSAEQLVKAE